MDDQADRPRRGLLANRRSDRLGLRRRIIDVGRRRRACRWLACRIDPRALLGDRLALDASFDRGNRLSSSRLGAGGFLRGELWLRLRPEMRRSLRWLTVASSPARRFRFVGLGIFGSRRHGSRSRACAGRRFRCIGRMPGINLQNECLDLFGSRIARIAIVVARISDRIAVVWQVRRWRAHQDSGIKTGRQRVGDAIAPTIVTGSLPLARRRRGVV